MLALLFLIIALIAFAIEIVVDYGGIDLFAVGLFFLTLAFIFGNKIVARRVPQ